MVPKSTQLEVKLHHRSDKERGPFMSVDQQHAFSFDVGLPSVCCEYVLLPLVNKDAALAYDRTEYRWARILN